jgi:hypothetical protein
MSVRDWSSDVCSSDLAQLFMSSLIVLLIATMMARLGGWLGVKRRPSL